jgi:hypothetical protein
MSATSALEQIIEINKSIVKLPLTQEAILELLGLMNQLAERIADIEERLYMRESGLN